MKKKVKKYIGVKTIYGNHVCVLEPDERGYVVTVPGLPGVVTWGKDIEHAKKMIREAIELCILCLAEEKLSSKVAKREPNIMAKLSV